MSPSTYVAKMASPAVESSWHLPLSINLSPLLHQCSESLWPHTYTRRSAAELWCILMPYLRILHTWRELARIPAHTPSTFELTSSTRNKSVAGASILTKSHACTPLHCLHGMLQAMMQYLTWEYVPHELCLCSLKLHYYQFPPNIQSCILIIAKVWMWIADSLKLNL